MKIDVVNHVRKNPKQRIVAEYKQLEAMKHIKMLDLKEMEDYIRFIVLVYSYDSVLNDKRNFLPLDERKLKAAKMLKMDILTSEGEVKAKFKKDLFDLTNDEVFNAIFQYIISQNNELWTEICTIEAEIAEFQMLRMKPMKADTDKDLMMATEKKDKLMKGVHERIEILKKQKEEFFADYDDVKNKAKERGTIELRAKSIHEFF